MAEHYHHCCRSHPAHIAAGQPARRPHGHIALGDIEQQGEHAHRPASSSQHVSGADVPAARAAHVATGLPFHQDVSEGNGAQQVSEQESGNWHHDWKGNSASLVYTLPLGRNWLWYKQKPAAVKLPN